MGMLRSTTIRHPGLKAQLEFLAAQYNVDIEFISHATPWEFRVQRPPKHVVILSYNNDTIRGFGALYGKDQLAYTGPWSTYGLYCPSGAPIAVPSSDGSTLRTVGLRVANVIYLYFSLEHLFGTGSTSSTWLSTPDGGFLDGLGHGRWVDGGDVAALRRKLFDDIFNTHMPEAVKAIKEFSWDIEKATFLQKQEAFFAEVVQKWSTRLSQIGQEKWDIGDRLRVLSREEAQLQESIRSWEAGAEARAKRAEDAFATYVSYLSSGVIADPDWSGTCFTFTVNPMVVSTNGRTDEGVEMGPWVVNLDFGGGSPHTIQKTPTSILSSDGFWHPHVSQAGRPCLGNAEPMLIEAIGRQDLAGAITIVLEFLRGYNPDSPYCRIERWDPDYEDEDACYENSSPHDCVVCTRNCSYREGAEGRCAEYYSDDCIDCRDCDECSTAEDYCHDDRVERGTPWYCIFTCTRRRCAYYRDVHSCRNSYDEDQCIECPYNDCEYHPSFEEESEAPEEAPVASTNGNETTEEAT